MSRVSEYTERFEARQREPLPRIEVEGEPYTPSEYRNPDPLPRMTFTHTYADFGDQTWNRLLSGHKLLINNTYPDCPIVNIPFSCVKEEFMPARWQILAKTRRTVRGNLVVLDPDVMCASPCDPFEEDFDVGLTDSAFTWPIMPFNAGVFFARDTAAAQEFFDTAMVMSNDIPTQIDRWFIDQLAIYGAYKYLQGRCKFKIFPHAQYNYAPAKDVLDVDSAHFIHLKGPRKRMADQYIRAILDKSKGPMRNVALPCKDLMMEDPRPDPDGLRATAPNIKHNVAAGFKPYKPEKVKGGKIAIVGYGPSLKDTWETLKNFDGAIWTVSKAHDFLLERGITPTFHTDLDYREHKAYFNRIVSPTTKYVLATQVHPKYTAMLPSSNLEMFASDVPGSEPSPGYPLIEGQFDVGLQAAFMAYKAGYREQHWFGIDASYAGDESHAGSHEGIRSMKLPIEVQGRVYTSSQLLLRQALFCERMLCRYPFINPVIHGNGMLRPFLQERGRAKVV